MTLFKIYLFFPPPWILYSHLSDPTVFFTRIAQFHVEGFTNNISNWSVYTLLPLFIYKYISLYFRVYLIQASSMEPCLLTNRKEFLHALKSQSMFMREHLHLTADQIHYYFVMLILSIHKYVCVLVCTNS